MVPLSITGSPNEPNLAANWFSVRTCKPAVRFHFGPLDILFCRSGQYPMANRTSSIDDLDPSFFRMVAGFVWLRSFEFEIVEFIHASYAPLWPILAVRRLIVLHGSDGQGSDLPALGEPAAARDVGLYDWDLAADDEIPETPACEVGLASHHRH